MTAGQRGARRPRPLAERPGSGAGVPPVSRDAATWFGVGAWPVAVYTGSRLLLLIVAVAVMMATHRSLGTELTLFDGHWYLRLARNGYPSQPLHSQSTLGFFPLYPLLIRGLAGLLGCSLLVAALIISFAGGLAATVLVGQLATIWWGPRTACRAVLAFCLFPGSIVFSMSYSECVTIPLVLGCLLALRSRRWALAGALAGLATAAEPAALIVIPVCLVGAVRQLRLAGWADRSARRSLLAPLLAPVGVGAFAAFLWLWTGTPFAYLTAQRYGWSQQASPFALLEQPAVRRTLHHPAAVTTYLLNFNLWNGVLGAVLLALALAALVRVRHDLSTGALVWAFGVGAFTLWSVRTPPNARMLLLAFPTVIVWPRRLPRRFPLFVAAEAALLLTMSVLTFGDLMRP